MKPARQLGRPRQHVERELARRDFDVREAMSKVCPQVLAYREYNPVVFGILGECTECGELLSYDGHCYYGCKPGKLGDGVRDDDDFEM
jgi:hypothetical protein